MDKTTPSPTIADGSPDEPNIFDYTDYRRFLADITAFKQSGKKLSYRALAKLFRLKSPNYIQLVITGKRNLTKATATQMVEGMGLSGYARMYFLTLIDYDLSSDTTTQLKLLEKLRHLSSLGRCTTRKDAPFFTNWLNQIIWEMASLRGILLGPETIHRLLGGWASREEVQSSFQFLIDNRYIVFDESNGCHRQSEIAFEPFNETRNIDIQTNHFRFLAMAQRKLSDPLENREYQGLTIAVSKQRLPEVKRRIRNFIKQLATDLAEDENADRLIRVQCAMFSILQDETPKTIKEPNPED